MSLLNIKKHLPGRHNQKAHAPRKYRKPATLDEKVAEGVAENWPEDTVRAWLEANGNKTVYEMTQTEFVNRNGRGIGFNGAKLGSDPELDKLAETSKVAREAVEKAGLGWYTDHPADARYHGLSKAKQALIKKWQDAAQIESNYYGASRDRRQKELHEKVIKAALANGKHVPENVRAEYGL